MGTLSTATCLWAYTKTDGNIHLGIALKGLLSRPIAGLGDDVHDHHPMVPYSFIHPNSMRNIVAFRSLPTALQRRKFVSALALAALLGGPLAQIPTIATATQVNYQQQGWSTKFHMARTNREQLVVQLNILNKPITSYANAVYILYARQNNQWVQVFTSVGARLITNASGNTVLAPEVINLRDLQLGREVDLSNLEFKAVAMLRYDARGERRDQTVQVEQVERYSQITQTSTLQIAESQSSSDQTILVSNAGNSATRQEQSQFNLTIVQKQKSSSHVTARISLKEKRAEGFSAEKLVGDFRYKLKGKPQKAKFLKGMKVGDRVVVRLFDAKKKFIGYSEFELLAYNSTVTLVLPNRAADYGIVRTIYGIDTNDDFSIDRNATVYDYFTQVTRVNNFLDARVSFFSSIQTVNFSSFEVANLPAMRSRCSYPDSFQTGSFRLVNQVITAFSDKLMAILTSSPGQLVQTIKLSSTEWQSFEVSQLLITDQSVKVTQSGRESDEEDGEDDDRKPRKRHCNQGIGNGSEGCDPGNSHPHGGSNDEGGKKPGHKGKH